jgi:hypothetical protein
MTKAKKPLPRKQAGQSGKTTPKRNSDLPGARARGSRESMPERGVSAPVRQLTGHARELEFVSSILERAQLVDPGDKFSRVMCIVEVMRDGLWVKGETAYTLGEVWELKGTTVENDASEASKVIRAVTDPTSAASTFWAVAVEQLAATRKHLEKVARLADEVNVSSAMDVKMISDALGRCSDSIDRAAQTFGRASGSLQAGTTVNVGIKLDVGDGKKIEASKDQMVDAWATVSEGWMKAVQAVGGNELAERARERFVADMRAKLGGT